MPSTTSKAQYLELRRVTLLKQLEKLLLRLEDRRLDADDVEKIKAEVEDCQRRYKELGFDESL